MINPSIFKAYDIRGHFPQDFNENDLATIVGTYLSLVSRRLNKQINRLQISIGRDIRPESETIHKKVVGLLVSAGVKVTNFDLISVNDLYFSVGYYELDGGLMATASHDPAGYAGLKMAYFDGNKNDGLQFISGNDIKNNLLELVPATNGEILKQDLAADHVNWLLSQIDKTQIKPLRVIVDTGGGMNILLLSKLLPQLPLDVSFINSEFDPTFSRRAPNPLEPGATDSAKKLLLEKKADLGLVYDIDGDRFFLLDEKGELVKGDMTLLVIAEYLLKENPGAGIAYNAICSKSVPEKVVEFNGLAYRSKVGYRYLSETMKKNNGIMSGEVSSHFAFAKSWFADSAFLATLYALISISQKGLPLSTIVTANETWFRANEVSVKINNPQESLEAIKTAFADGQIDELDGITVDYGDWWFNVRGSNTEPLIKITVETKDQSELEEKQNHIVEQIKKLI